jgi:C-terminal processing protease CtpA/Prc
MLGNVGILRISFFSGAFGIRFSKLLDAAVESLKAQGCDCLIIDLRGCLGGSLGFAHLVSYLCPDRIPIGYDVTRKRLQRGYNVAHFPRVSMPSTRLGLLFCLARFSVQDKSLVLLTQGLGKQPSESQFGDFKLHIEFNCALNSNSGVLTRALGCAVML